MAKAVADVNEETQGGYASNEADSKSSDHPHTRSLVHVLTSFITVTGFSHMHDSGTGGVSTQRALLGGGLWC